MTDPVADTWHTRDLPVLRAAVKLADDNDFGAASPAGIVTATGLTETDVERALRALRDDGLLAPVGPTRASGEWSGVGQLTGRARRLAGSWPTEETALDRIIAALEAIAENTDDEDTRTRARKILDGLAGTGRQIGIAVAGAAITGQIPGA